MGSWDDRHGVNECWEESLWNGQFDARMPFPSLLLNES